MMESSSAQTQTTSDQPPPVAQSGTPARDLGYDPQVVQGPPPEPLPPSKELLPWDKLALEEKQKEEEKKRKEKEAHEKKEKEAQEKKKGGFSSVLNKAGEAAKKVAADVGEGVDKVKKDVRGKIETAQENRFKQQMALPESEKLWYEYTCTVQNGQTPFNGYLYVSDNYISFHAQSGGVRLKFSIPLKSVVSVQNGVALPVSDGGAPFVQLILNQRVKMDAILVYTSDSRVHLFYKFRTYHDPVSSFHDHAMNVIDHAWRKEIKH
eukprot:TRINITY_DN2892_c0_g1_i1.p1 TRINITY_DN2892_c0_g1~~TRINITY_DN2892_c0_g1_i1.p1  ORF type:complete len:265 (+),score=87.30 TRINITY_DN2892_c0_g1_i1:67-861(+)